MKLDASFNYFYSLIDRNGIIQFTKGYKKDEYYGYAIEDQARALIVALLLNNKKITDLLLNIILRVKSKNGVKMLWNSKGEFLDKEDYFEDASAEVVWALGEYLSKISNSSASGNIYKLYTHLVQGLKKTNYTRVIAYSLLGITKIKDKTNTKIFSDKLIQIFIKNSSDKWTWFEDKLIYGNALLPWSLFLSYEVLKNEKILNVAENTLKFLIDETKHNGIPIAIGNKGWWFKNKNKPIYDQQPIDISYMVLSLLDAYRITGKKYYLWEAENYYRWFYGNNLQNVCMIRNDGGCFDGLNEDGVNLNSGAESHICYLLAKIIISKYLKIENKTIYNPKLIKLNYIGE